MIAKTDFKRNFWAYIFLFL